LSKGGDRKLGSGTGGVPGKSATFSFPSCSLKPLWKAATTDPEEKNLFSIIESGGSFGKRGRERCVEHSREKKRGQIYERIIKKTHERSEH